MGILRLPGLVRTTQPQSGPAPIDWANPITRGLFLWLDPISQTFVTRQASLAWATAPSKVIGASGSEAATNGSTTAKTANQSIFNGLAAVSCFSILKHPAVGASSQSIFRKDGEFTAAQMGPSGVRAIVWTSGGSTATAYISAPANTYYPLSTVYDGATLTLTCGTTTTSVAKTGVISSFPSTPLCIGGSEGGTETIAVNVRFKAYWARVLSAKETASLLDNPSQIWLSKPRVMLLAAGPDVIVALTGQSTTAAAGTVSPSNAIPVTGSSGTAVAGSVSVGSDVTVALAGQAVTTSRGTLAPSAAKALTGQSSTAAGGSVSPSAALALTGQALSAQQGLMTPSRAILIAGQAGTAATGSAGAGIATALAGQTSTAQLGTVSASGNVVVALSGQAATVAQGSMAAFAASAAKFNQSAIMRATVTNRSSTARVTSVAASSTMRSSFSQSTIMRLNPLNATATMSDAAINRTANLL